VGDLAAVAREQLYLDEVKEGTLERKARAGSKPRDHEARRTIASNASTVAVSTSSDPTDTSLGCGRAGISGTSPDGGR